MIDTITGLVNILGAEESIYALLPQPPLDRLQLVFGHPLSGREVS